MATSWSSTKSIRDALKKVKKTNEKFFEGLSAFVDSHLKALRSLTDEELAKMAASEYGTRTLAWVLEGALSSDQKLAVKLVDALVTKASAKYVGPRAAQAILLAAQDDNMHQGVVPERLRAAIDVAAPFGERDPDVYVLAAYCAAELAAWDEAIEWLGKAKAKRAKQLKAVKNSKLFKPMAKDARFLAIFGAKAKPAAKKKLVPVKLSNQDAIAAFAKFVKQHDSVQLGDTWPSDATNVDFWFANRTAVANDHFRQWASTGDGSLLALWKTDPKDKNFEKAPVVFLGGEGDLAVLGANVADVLALLERCGSEVLDNAIQYGCDAPDGDGPERAWVETTLGRRIDDQPKKVVSAAGKTLLPKLKKLTKELGTD